MYMLDIAKGPFAIKLVCHLPALWILKFVMTILLYPADGNTRYLPTPLLISPRNLIQENNNPVSDLVRKVFNT